MKCFQVPTLIELPVQVHRSLRIPHLEFQVLQGQRQEVGGCFREWLVGEANSKNHWVN